MKHEKRYLYYSILPCCLLLIVIGIYAYGYNPPTCDPPGCNLPAPINASLNPQTKAGNLTIGGNLTTGSFTMAEGAEANKVLTTNASGIATWQAAATGATPGGTTGFVQFNDNGLFGSDLNLFWDNIKERLGIGTMSPGSKLDVNGMITISGGEATTHGLKALRLPTGISNIDAGLSIRVSDKESIVQFGNNLASCYTGAVDSSKAGVMVRLDTRNKAGSTSYANPDVYTLFQIQTREAGVADGGHTVPFQLRAAPTGSFIMDSEGNIGLGGLPGTAKLNVNGDIAQTSYLKYLHYRSTDKVTTFGVSPYVKLQDGMGAKVFVVAQTANQSSGGASDQVAVAEFLFIQKYGSSGAIVGYTEFESALTIAAVGSPSGFILTTSLPAYISVLVIGMK